MGKEYNGAALSYYDQCLVGEEVSKADGSAGLSYIVHAHSCVDLINVNGTRA